MKNIRLVCGVVLVAAFSAAAADGVWTAGSGVWTNTAMWTDGLIPDTGGAASFVGTGGTVTVPSGYPFNLSVLSFNTNGATVDWVITGETNTLVAPAVVRMEANNNLFFNMALAGSDGFQKTGVGTLKLQAANPLLSGPVQVLAGRLLIASDSYLGQTPETVQSNAVVLDSASIGNDDATVTLAETRGVTLGTNGGYVFGRNSNQMVMASPITGSGNLYILTQTGYVQLSNTNNHYTGDTVVGSTGPGVYSTAPSATLILGDSGVIPDGAGAGSLVIDGAWKGLLDLNGKTETVNRIVGLGNAVISNSAASIGVLHAGTDGVDTNFSGSIRTRVVLDKIGSGTLTYSNVTASAGLLQVSEGAVKAPSAGAISQTAVLLDGATLKTPIQTAGQRFAGPLLLAQDSTLDRTEAVAPFVWSGPLLPTNAVGVPVLTVSGGSGPFVMGSTNRSAVFGIDANVADGVLFTNRVWLETLPVSAAWSIAAGSDVAVGTPGLLGSGPMTLTNHSVRIVASDSLGAGGETVTVQGTGNSVWFDATRDSGGRLSDDPSYAFTASNNVAFDGTSAQVGFDGAGTVTYTGTISGTGALVKNGSGDTVLEAANSFVGGVQVNAGRLLVSDDSQLGDSANAITLADGHLGSASENPLTLSRTVSVTSGGLYVPGAALELDGIASGTLTKTGAGTLTLGGASGNTSLDLYVAGGVAVLNKSGTQAVRHILGVDTGAVVRLAGSGGDLIGGNVALTGGTLDLNGISESVGSLTSTSLTSVVTNNGGASATLTVGEGNAGGTFYGSFAGDALSLTKTGTNTFAFAGADGTQSADAMNVQNGVLALGAGVRCLRMTPGATRSGAAPAIGEIQLTLRGRPLSWPASTSTSASSSVGTNASWMVYDNNSRSYWQANSAPAWITVDAKTPQLCDGYRWYTSNTNSGGDPLNWTVEISPDGVNFFTADVRTGQTVTTSRGALGGDCAFGATAPCYAVGDSTVADIASGATINVMLPNDAAAALTGAGTLNLLSGSSLAVDDLSGFSGIVSGNGTLRLGGNAPLRVSSAAASVTAVNGGAVPAAVIVGASGETFFGGAIADGLSTFGLTKQGSGTLSLADAGSTYSGDTRVETGTLKIAAPTPMRHFRYIRFNPTMTQNGNVPNSGFVLAISDFQLTSNGVVVAYPTGRTITEVTRTTNSDDNPTNAINGSITDRWLSSVIPNPLTIDTKTGMTFNGYRIYSSGKNSADYGRTPTDWTVAGSDDGANWTTLYSESGVPTPAFVSGTGQLIGNFPAQRAHFPLPLEFYAETNNAALKVAAVTARYLRFTVTDTRYTNADFGNTGFQLDELQLMRNGSPILYPAGTVASAPSDGYNDYGGRYFPPQMSVDNVLPTPGTDTNRWYSVAMVNPMTVDMGQPTTFDAYRWYTGPNGIGRDPLGWKLEVSNNTTNWYTVDVQTNQAITSDRNVIAGTWPLDIPAGLQAADAIPDGSRTYVAAGATLRIEAASETVGPLSGTGTVSLATGSTLGLNLFEDAAFDGVIDGANGTLVLAGDHAQTFTGATPIPGDFTVAFQGGRFGGTLQVDGSLTVTGSVAYAQAPSLPYSVTLFTFGSLDEASRAALIAGASSVNVPQGFVANVRVTENTATLTVSSPGTLFMLK